MSGPGSRINYRRIEHVRKDEDGNITSVGSRSMGDIKAEDVMYDIHKGISRYYVQNDVCECGKKNFYHNTDPDLVCFCWHECKCGKRNKNRCDCKSFVEVHDGGYKKYLALEIDGESTITLDRLVVA